MSRIRKYFDYKEFDDSGLARKSSENASRIINKDGSFNILRKGIARSDRFSFYHWMISTSWLKFTLVILAFFLALNLLFNLVYFIIGWDYLKGLESNNFFEEFLEVYFFSIQTFTTVGYGRVSPWGLGAGLVSSIEALVGIMSAAIATGLLYGRFARPIASIRFSKNALIAPYKERNAFEFRMANLSQSVMMNVEVQVLLSLLICEKDRWVRRYFELNLERSKINFFPMSWTVVHPIDENSPFYQKTFEELQKQKVEVLILVKGFDETFAQTTYSRYSYTTEEIIFNASFENILEVNAKGIIENDIGRLDHYHQM